MDRRHFTRMMGMGSVAMALMPSVPFRAGARYLAERPGDPLDLRAVFTASPDKLPHSARPWVYWMWIADNITARGITADLEAMHRIGIGGVIMMNLDGRMNKAVPRGPMQFMDAQWQQMVLHAIRECKRLGMEFDLNNDDGWNSGGPWITPALNMQMLTWTETRLSGPASFSAVIAPPAKKLDTYTEVAVLAVPVPPAATLPVPRASAVPGAIHGLALDYGAPVKVRSLTVTRVSNKMLPRKVELWSSPDGAAFTLLRRFDTGWFSAGTPPEVSVGLGSAMGRYFRLLMPDLKAGPTDITFKMGTEDCVDHWRVKAGFAYMGEHGQDSPIYGLQDPVVRREGTIPRPEEVVDLSARIKDDGSLRWDVPAGDWVVLRIGYTPTGRSNKMASGPGLGLDTDRYSKKSLETQLSGMVDPVIAAARPLSDRGLTYIHTDSYEAGAANWTGALAAEFKKRRGYDVVPWLAVMAGGRLIGSSDQSSRFLWDIRRTLADMFVDNNLKYFRELCHHRNLKFTSEPAGRGQFLYDPVFFQATSDLPMGECWNQPQEARPRPDCKAAASAAHILDVPVAGAEIFTQNRVNSGRWAETPFSLKAKGDMAFCYGINRYFFHRCILQPDPDRKPGLTWPGVGINFDTTQTWWNAADGYVAYLSRCQLLLQQGRFFADVAMLTDEGAPNSLIRPQHEAVDPAARPDPSTITEGVLRHFHQMPFLPPRGYDYDYLDPGTVLGARVVDGRVVLPTGMRYRVLVLWPTTRMTLPLARKLRQLVSGGATVVGMKPASSPSLSGYPHADTEIASIADELWGSGNGEAVRSYGKGRLYPGNQTARALQDLSLPPDFGGAYLDGTKGSPNLEFIHRSTGTADIYFVSNQSGQPVEVNCSFRIRGIRPEIWRPDTGSAEPCEAFRLQRDGCAVPLALDGLGSLFVVFPRAGTTVTSGRGSRNEPPLARLKEITGPWSLRFEPGGGGPGDIRMPRLASWSEHPDPGVRYYSGTVRYLKTFDVAGDWVGGPLYLELGTVRELARVTVNGHRLASLWKPPFRVDISRAVRPGENRLEIDVVNLWVNRLIGDAALAPEKKVAAVNWNPYKADSPLPASGLLGPVWLLRHA